MIVGLYVGTAGEEVLVEAAGAEDVGVEDPVDQMGRVSGGPAAEEAYDHHAFSRRGGGGEGGRCGCGCGGGGGGGGGGRKRSGGEVGGILGRRVRGGVRGGGGAGGGCGRRRRRPE